MAAVASTSEYVPCEIASVLIPYRAIRNENSPTWKSPIPTAMGAMLP